jgi:hypothetical protein
MSQIFRRRTNRVVRVGIVVAIVLVTGLIGLAIRLDRSPRVTQVGAVREQPVPFSHETHVGRNGFDCRYCHSSVERSGFAGIPPTRTCMNCHVAVLPKNTDLMTVREGFKAGRPIEWTRVHDLPDYVFFDHSIHIHKGVGCTTCHGPVDQMAVMRQEASLQMDWCLTCHRNPEQYVRPRSEVFSVSYQPPANQIEVGRRLVAEYAIEKLTSCSTCHY